MNAQVYQFDILRTDRARELHALHADIVNDETLAQDEKNELCGLIREKFGRLNALAAGQPRPRW